MNKQPESLRLADALQSEEYFARGPLAMEAAAELRRLHKVNAELLNATSWASNYIDTIVDPNALIVLNSLNKAIAKALGEQQ